MGGTPILSVLGRTNGNYVGDKLTHDKVDPVRAPVREHQLFGVGKRYEELVKVAYGGPEDIGGDHDRPSQHQHAGAVSEEDIEEDHGQEPQR